MRNVKYTLCEKPRGQSWDEVTGIRSRGMTLTFEFEDKWTDLNWMMSRASTPVVNIRAFIIDWARGYYDPG